jgi:hypothetical protein
MSYLGNGQSFRDAGKQSRSILGLSQLSSPSAMTPSIYFFTSDPLQKAYAHYVS